MIKLETLKSEERFSLGNRTGTVIYATPGSVYLELDSYLDEEGRIVPKHKTHWAGQTKVKRTK